MAEGGMAPAGKQLSIILPSYNDARIKEAIESVRRFDDIDTVRLVIIDGGSKPEVVDILKGAVRPGDILVSEPDKGIFDALNKGLDRVETPYLGWLGSDDLFTGQVKASDVVAALQTSDLFVTTVAVFRGDRVRRMTRPWGAANGLTRYGLHNPHYGTFGHSKLMQASRFRLDLMGSDIAYFLEVFGGDARVSSTSAICTLQAEGGFSTRSLGKMLTINRELWQVYRARSNMMAASAALLLKLGYKGINAFWFKLRYLHTSAVLNGARG
jgi:glycosyltransferase